MKKIILFAKFSAAVSVSFLAAAFLTTNLQSFLSVGIFGGLFLANIFGVFNLKNFEL